MTQQPTSAPQHPQQSAQPATASAPQTGMTRARKRNWGIAAGVAVVVGIGAFVGSIAGDIAHRAPRGSGLRVAVLDFGSAPIERAVRDAVVRDLAWEMEGRARVTVIPPLVLESKRQAMLRGGVDGATLADAADVLDADLILDATFLAGRGSAAAAARAAGDVKTVAWDALMSLRERTGESAVRSPLVPTEKLDAYTAFLDGERLLQQEAQPRAAAERYRAALALDPELAEAAAQLAFALFFLDDETRTPAELDEARRAVELARRHEGRLSQLARMQTLALHAWLAHDDAPDDVKAQLREPAIAACRALTVQLPEERVGHYMLGRAYSRLFNGPSEALRHLESARRLTPEYFPITAELVVAWLKLSDRRHAEQALRGFLYTVPEHPEATRLLKALSTPTGVVGAGSTPAPSAR